VWKQIYLLISWLNVLVIFHEYCLQIFAPFFDFSSRQQQAEYLSVSIHTLKSHTHQFKEYVFRWEVASNGNNKVTSHNTYTHSTVGRKGCPCIHRKPADSHSASSQQVHLTAWVMQTPAMSRNSGHDTKWVGIRRHRVRHSSPDTGVPGLARILVTPPR
jgi:hypothetical protein